MTIVQRIELRKLGYSKEEIQELVEQENAAAVEPVAEPETDTLEVAAVEAAPAPDPSAAQLLAAINNLTLALQGHKLNTTEQPVAAPETSVDIFNNMLN